MIKLLKCNEEVIKKTPSIYKLVNENYGENHVLVYAVLNDDKISFLVVGNEGCMYISDNGYSNFTMDTECVLRFYRGKNYGVYFNTKDITFRDNRGFFYSIVFEKLDDIEEDSNGRIIFNQMDVVNDTFCQLAYLQMYNVINGKASIYNYHTREPKQVYIEENKSKKKFKFGLMPRDIRNYTCYEFERDTFGYNVMLLKDHGFISYLMEGKNNLGRDYKIQKFVKADFIFGDKLKEFWPFVSTLDKEKVYDMIENFRFLKSIPDEMIEVYNGNNRDIETINEVLKAFKDLRDHKDYKMELRVKK